MAGWLDLAPGYSLCWVFSTCLSSSLDSGHVLLMTNSRRVRGQSKPHKHIWSLCSDHIWLTVHWLKVSPMAKPNINVYGERGPTKLHGRWYGCSLLYNPIIEEWRTGNNNPIYIAYTQCYFPPLKGNTFTRLKNKKYMKKYAVKKSPTPDTLTLSLSFTGELFS